jgi:hypothetical protein
VIVCHKDCIISGTVALVLVFKKFFSHFFSCGNLNWIAPEDSDMWRAYVNALMNLWVP